MLLILNYFILFYLNFSGICLLTYLVFVILHIGMLWFFPFFKILFLLRLNPLSTSLSPRDLSRSFPAPLLQSYLGHNGGVPTPLSQGGYDILSHCLLCDNSAPGCEVTYASSILLFFFYIAYKSKQQQLSDFGSICSGSEICHSGLWSQARSPAPTGPYVGHLIPH